MPPPQPHLWFLNPGAHLLLPQKYLCLVQEGVEEEEASLSHPLLAQAQGILPGSLYVALPLLIGELFLEHLKSTSHPLSPLLACPN